MTQTYQRGIRVNHTENKFSFILQNRSFDPRIHSLFSATKHICNIHEGSFVFNATRATVKTESTRMLQKNIRALNENNTKSYENFVVYLVIVERSTLSTL